VKDVVPEVSRAAQTLRRNAWPKHLGTLIPILTIYFSLAFYHIDHQSLWTDEVISVMRADPTGPLLTRERWFSGQSPPYFLLLHLWAKWWGTSEFALRSLSALLGAIVVCLAYITALCLCDSRVAWIGATLLATSPFLIWYSQEARYVILMILATLLAMYAFDRALSTKRLGWWLCYSGSLMLAIVIFVVNVFLPMAHGLYLMCTSSKRPVLRRWVACLLVVMAFFIWQKNDRQIWQLGGMWQKLFAHMTTISENLPSMKRVEGLSAGGSRQFTVMALPYTFFAFSTGFSLGPSLPELHVSQSLATLQPHV
jgi:4-amino-4-deoxy-L-arabinose transferase-like glycosyltransferase